MPTFPKTYSGAVTIIKAVSGGVGVGAIGIVLNWLLDAITTGDFTLSAEQSAALAAVAAAAWIAVKNFAKVKLGWTWLP